MYKGEHRKRRAQSEVAWKSRWRWPRIFIAIAAIGISTGTTLTVVSPGPNETIQAVQAAPATSTLLSVRTYTVRRGDTLSRISARFCGSARYYPGIARASGVRNPNIIRVGQRLTIRCSRSGVRGAMAASIVRGVRYSTHYGYYGLEALWRGAGGPSWAAPRAARIALCESGGYIYAHNPSGASGLWQILGLPFRGNPYNPYTNARMAVVKFRSAGSSFAPWVCR